METEIVIQQFGKLEEKIEYLIESCGRIEAENSRLTQENQTLAAQLQEKIAAEKQHLELKGLVRSKIDNLMGKLEGISEE